LRIFQVPVILSSIWRRNMNIENILDYLKILYALAWADNKLQKEELNLLGQIADNFELDENQKKIVQNWATNPISLKDLKKIDFSSFQMEQKKYILTLALAIAKSDGIVTQDEKEFIEEIQSLLDMKDLNFDDLMNELKSSQELYSGL